MKRYPMTLASIGLLVVCYAAFLFWYGGTGTPLTPAEVDAYMAILQERHAQSPDVDTAALQRFRAFAESDDGRSFSMVNLIRLRQQPAYPSGADPGGTVADADSRYTRALMPLLLAHGGHPIAVLTPFAVLFEAGPDTAQWTTVAIVRHRSRRDFLDMLTSPEYARAEMHKWASVTATVVVASSGTVLPDPRAVVLLLLAGIGGAIAVRERRRRKLSR